LNSLWPAGTPGSWDVGSAGTHAASERRMDPSALEVLAETGYDGRAFRSRPLTADVIIRSDLILTAERRHRTEVVTAVPAALHYTFTLTQFAVLARGVPGLEAVTPPEQGFELRDAALAQRGRVQPVPSQQEDIPDPIGKPHAQFRECRDQIRRAIHDILLPIRQN